MTPVAVAFAAWIVELLFPRRCVSCGASADLLCSACRGALRPLGPPCCLTCGAPTAWPVERCRECSGRRLLFTSARAAVAYEGPARALVHGWKERGLRRAADLAADLVATHVERPTADAITHIPPDPARQLERGRHPADALAHALALRWEIEHARLVRRTATIARQAGLPRHERGGNVRGVFAPATASPARVVLVDDVYTTGSTAAAATGALRSAGASVVDVVTFARAVR